MPITDVYIGSLDDPQVTWDPERMTEDTWNGNIPAKLSPFFPYPGAKGNPFREVMSMVGRGEVDSVRLDWGATVAKATGAQIQELFARLYPDLSSWYEQHTTGPWDWGEIPDDMRKLEAFVSQLDPRQKYALVAIESS